MMKIKYRLLILVLSIICIESKAEGLKIDSITQNNNLTLNLKIPYSSFTQKRSKPKHWFDPWNNISVFVGYSGFSGNLSNHLTNAFFWGCNFENYKDKLVYQFDGAWAPWTIRTKDSLIFQDQTYWKKNKPTSYVIGGFNVGYVIVDNEYFTLVPVGGVNLLIISADENKEAERSISTFSYKLGFFVDLKKIEMPRISPKSDLYCLRLSFGINSPLIKPKYSEYFNGSIFYVTIGLRTKQNKKGH